MSTVWDQLGDTDASNCAEQESNNIAFVNIVHLQILDKGDQDKLLA